MMNIPHMLLWSFDQRQSSIKRYFKLISWNINGLERLEKTLDIRTRGVISVIKREKPDAVFLQEVVPRSLALFRKFLPQYEVYVGNKKSYFVAMLTRRDTINVKSYEVIPYPSTTMNRNLLIVHAVYNGIVNIDLMTTHLESLDRSADERIQQLRYCFRKMLRAPSNRIVFFGGDLNLRDTELEEAGDTPPGIYDAWIATGERPEHAYTWDMEWNTNRNFITDEPPRFRLDRIYFRPSSSLRLKLRPISFKLQGQQMIRSIERFCSDHWAIQAKFEIS